MTAIDRPVAREGLLPWSLFAALIAMAGLPIYIHAPKFYVDSYGVGLASLGIVLALLRLIDVVQDPLLGWLAEHQKSHRGLLVAIATGVMTASMFGLFVIPPPIAPLVWFALCLVGLFSAFSFLTIAFYAQGVSRAERLGPTGHIRLAGWRETGSLLGVALAAMAPVAFSTFTDQPFTAFALAFAVLAMLAWAAMRHEWGGANTRPAKTMTAGIGPLQIAFVDPVLRRLLAIALINGTPVAVTSTLFLFFVESRLGSLGWEGPLLLLFFLSAASAAPVWTAVARRIGEKRTLLTAMGVSIAAFAWALKMGDGDLVPFAVVCVITGAALGADLTLLPALFARRLSKIASGGEALAFGLWSFVSKLSLAIAAVTLLPVLDAVGFVSGGTNSAAQLDVLALLYAGIPTVLKAVALGLLFTTDLSEA